jgi:uncharacterized repeat protein (TIGR03803 family)
MAIALQTEATRIYLVGDTFAAKDRIKAIGGHWDPDRRAWWIGKGKLAERAHGGIVRPTNRRTTMRTITLALFAALAIAQGQNLTTLHTFTNGIDGAYPFGTPTITTGGIIYGTCSQGGFNDGGTLWAYSYGTGLKTLYEFESHPGDGYTPYGGVYVDTEGNAYGTTTSGGINGGGIFYVVTSQGEEVLLYNFDRRVGLEEGGTEPFGTPLFANGYFFGTLASGGAADHGAVYRISADGYSGEYIAMPEMFGAPSQSALLPYNGHLYGSAGTYVYEVYPANEVIAPVAEMSEELEGGVVADSQGNLYGTASGTMSESQTGYIYEVVAGTRAVVTLHVFSGPDGANPQNGSLVMDAAGDLFGTTLAGGEYGYGVVFEVSGGNYSVLWSFTGGADGASPKAGLALSGSTLYGVTSAGALGYGTLFELEVQ